MIHEESPQISFQDDDLMITTKATLMIMTCCYENDDLDDQ